MQCIEQMMRLTNLQIRISQTYRMGLEDKTNISRRFIKQYVSSSTGQYVTGRAKRSEPEMVSEISEEELAEIQDNLRANGIHWNETNQPLITVKGTAQVKSFYVSLLGFFVLGTLLSPSSSGINETHHKLSKSLTKINLRTALI